MKTILVTGFEPFPGMPVNPTALLIERLPRRVARHRGTEFRYNLLPTTWSARETVTARLREEIAPSAIVHLGVDGQRRTVNVETRAVNRATRVRPDADGLHAGTTPLDPSGPHARFSSLPVRALRDAAARSGVPANISRNAGDYLCNATLWDSIASGIPSVFIHVPSLPRSKTDPRPSLQRIEAGIVQILKEVANRI
ncbi:peptidase C15 [Roseibium sp.]|uniref:pyroglutamyl-peptidase I family protein n=1 Tax=Roseibium sp. TaxID=1936156 RepID=UPI003A97D178